MTFHLHLISDSTGGTLSSVAKACLAQFDGVAVTQHFWPLVRSAKQLSTTLDNIRKNPGIIMYTLVDDALAQQLEKDCAEMGVVTLPVLQPILYAMSHTFGQVNTAKPGLQHRLNEEYFARMDAVDYALHHDDGQKIELGLEGRNDLSKADVILVGVSRTSKTPTCIYLANRGIKAANIPYVPGIPFPEKVLTLEKPLFVALTASADRLVDIRKSRLQHLGERRETRYLDEDSVQDEIREARKFYTRMHWPVIDVTRRSVEETAAEILTLLDQRREQQQKGF